MPSGAIFSCIVIYLLLDMANTQKYIVKEEVTKSDVMRMIDNAIDGKDMEKRVKSICDDVLENMFKTLWQRKLFWKK